MNCSKMKNIEEAIKSQYPKMSVDYVQQLINGVRNILPCFLEQNRKPLYISFLPEKFCMATMDLDESADLSKVADIISECIQEKPFVSYKEVVGGGKFTKTIFTYEWDNGDSKSRLEELRKNPKGKYEFVEQ